MTEDDRQRRIRLRRDGQQWEFDRAIRDSGRVYHWQPPGGGRLPTTVRMHDMISKHIARNAKRLETMAAAEAAAGHDVLALEFYFDAAVAFGNAQHPVLVNNDEKKLLHGSMIRCYDEVRRLAPATIERIDIPFGDSLVSGNLHLAPGIEGPAPLVFFIPGCDMTKEFVPHPLYNFAHQRNMHLFVFDGPGQGECNIRDLKLTLTNYEEAAVAAMDYLVDRPEVDEDRIGLYARSFGSYWGARFAAIEPRFKASAFMWASICDKHHLFEEESPRYKQLLSFMTGAPDEAWLDDYVASMGLEDIIPQIASPTLFTVGEYDPRSPVVEVLDLVETMTAPWELYVYADQHHNANLRGINSSGGPFWQLDTHGVAADWIRDRIEGRPIPHENQVSWLELSGSTAMDPATPRKERWFD